MRQYDGSRYGEKRGGDLVDYFVVWPKARGFRNDKSFTHPVRLGWSKPKSDDQESGDHKTGLARVREALKRSKRLILLGAVGVALWFGFWAGLRGLARLADSQKTGNWLFTMSGQAGQTNGTAKVVEGEWYGR